jgi:ATP:ADP antiporter, AAA family
VTRTALRLTITRALKIYRGEEARIAAFSLLHVLLSMVIGMVGTFVDALTVAGTDRGSPYLLYGISAVLLALFGLAYAGVTDRTDKRKVLSRAIVLAAAIPLGGSGLLFLSGEAPSTPLLSFLFVWRFLLGIILLMVFWDLTPFFFNARQGKRLFPLLALGGAVGYSIGSLVGAWLAAVIPAGFILLVIGGVTLFAALWFQVIRSNYSILDSPRYRVRTVLEEVRDGFRAFRGNPFVRAVGWNTVLFGVLSGLIVFTYNALVTARTTGTTEAAGLIGLQRAAVTILQATVFTKVLSQSAVGGRSRTSIVQQAAFLILGTVAFAVSMVGVADFTRQIEVALMSPAAMAAFAFLPARYRGRVMVLNNLVATATGILIATVFVALVGPMVQPLWFAWPIVALMVGRLAFGVLLNRRYTALLSESIVADSKLNLTRIEENTANILQDEALLGRIETEMAGQSDSVRVFVLGRLARAARSGEDLKRIAPLFESVSEELEALWVETIARVDFGAHREELAAAAESPRTDVRVAASVAILRGLDRTGGHEEFAARVEHLSRELEVAITGGTGEFVELLRILLRVEAATGKPLLEVSWDRLDDPRREAFLEALGRNPTPRFFPLVIPLLEDEEYLRPAVVVLAALPTEFLLTRQAELAELPVPVRCELLRVFQDPVLRREVGGALLREQLTPTGEGAEATVDLLVGRGESIIEAGLAVLSDPAPVGTHLGHLGRLVRHAAADLATVFPVLYGMRFAAEDVPSRLRALSAKTTGEYLSRLVLLVIILESLTLGREEDRALAFGVCQELTERGAVAQHNALEFIETKMSAEVRPYLLTHYEGMTVDEKRLRLRPLLRKAAGAGEFDRGVWRDAVEGAGDLVAAEVLALL